MRKTGNYFNVLFYTPSHIQGNFAAAYEYCNGYIYIVQLSMIAQFDYGFFSELVTRFSMLLSTELQPFLSDVKGLL